MSVMKLPMSIKRDTGILWFIIFKDGGFTLRFGYPSGATIGSAKSVVSVPPIIAAKNELGEQGLISFIKENEQALAEKTRQLEEIFPQKMGLIHKQASLAAIGLK